MMMIDFTVPVTERRKQHTTDKFVNGINYRGAPCLHGDLVTVAKTSRLSAIASSDLEMAGSRMADTVRDRLAACFA
jgi:hypothetical protein